MASVSPGRDPVPDDQSVKLTHLTVGVWRRRATRGSLFLLVLHSSDKFVLLSEDSFNGLQAQPRRLFSLPTKLHARSPFRTVSGTAGNFRVVALEIDWKDICGFNYHNPLCTNGRAVVEAAKLTKRQFKNMQEAQNFYLRQICAASPQHVNRRVGILRTYASSPDMMRPSVRRGALHSTDHDSLQRQQDHRQQQQQSQQLESQQSQQPMMLHQQQQHQLHALCHTASAGNHPHGRVHDAADLSSLPRQQAATPFAMVSPIPEEPCCSTAGASPQHTEAHPTCLTHAGVGTTSPPSARHTASTTLDTHAGPVPASQQPNALSETRHVGSAQQTGAHYQQHCHFADETLQQSDQASSSVQARTSRDLSSRDAHAASAEWLDVTSWTLPCHEFGYRTVTFSFVDPNLPEVLRPAINDNERLLKLYESGLPVWAIFLPTYGLYYRPWMRRMTWTMFIVVSVFSMACGFYDLYKNVPHLDQVVRRVLSAVCLPSTTIFQWLEDHAQIRLSILLTYLFGESIFVVHLLTWLGKAWNAVGQPTMRVIGPPLSALGAFVEQGGSQAILWGRSCGLATHAILKTVFGPPMLHLLQFLRMIGQTLLPLWLALVWMVTGPVRMCIAAGQSVGAAGRGLWQGAQPLRQAASSAAGLVRTASLAAPATQSSAQTLSQQVQWWRALMPSDAWELMRGSALKVMRALQTLGKLTAQLGSDINKHRVSLGRRSWRLWRRSKARLQKAFAAVVAWPVAACKAVFHYITMRMQRKREPAAESGTLGLSRQPFTDPDDRPILNGISANTAHSHTD